MKTGLKLTECSKKCGEMWREMTDEQKKPFEAQQAQDKVRYEKQLKEAE